MSHEWPHEKLYRAHIAERREIAFSKWRESGYADQSARAEFIRLFELAGKIGRKIAARNY